VITGTARGAPHVKVFSGADAALLRTFFAYNPAFLGGVFVAAGDINGDGRADIITGAGFAGPGSGPHVEVFSGSNGALLASFFAFDPAFVGGVRVATVHVNGTSDLLVGAGPFGGPHVKVLDALGLTLLDSFFAYLPSFAGGVFVAG
jgi:hypothetical protein